MYPKCIQGISEAIIICVSWLLLLQSTPRYLLCYFSTVCGPPEGDDLARLSYASAVSCWVEWICWLSYGGLGCSGIAVSLTLSGLVCMNAGGISKRKKKSMHVLLRPRFGPTHHHFLHINSKRIKPRSPARCRQSLYHLSHEEAQMRDRTP